MKANETFFFMDSTHGTCRGIQQGEKVCLFTLVVKNQITGMGVPVAFMLTNLGNTTVIANFLSRIKNFSGFNPKQATIDCDQAEKAALLHVWPSTLTIVFCRWHIMKAWAHQLRTHLKKANCGNSSDDEKKEATSKFRDVLKINSIEDSKKKLQAFFREYDKFPELLEYVEKQWVKNLDYIVDGASENFIRSASTNNYIESFHSLLKQRFLSRSGKRRPGTLISILIDNVIPYFTAQESRVNRGRDDRQLDKAEKQAMELADAIPAEKMGIKVRFEGKGQLTVTSFSNDAKTYSVHLNSKSRALTYCDCKHYVKSTSFCKHIFLGFRFWSHANETAMQREK